jgi:hypothetical protein
MANADVWSTIHAARKALADVSPGTNGRLNCRSVATRPHLYRGLGARRVSSSPYEESGTRWHLMADPEGNELCVCDGGAESAAS